MATSKTTTEKAPAPKSNRVSLLESQVAALLAERGIPADPIAATRKNLADHLAVRDSMVPSVDFSEHTKRLEDLPEDFTPEHTEQLRFGLSRLNPAGVDMSYVNQLADELHQHALDRAANPVAVDDTPADDADPEDTEE